MTNVETAVLLTTLIAAGCGATSGAKTDCEPPCEDDVGVSMSRVSVTEKAVDELQIAFKDAIAQAGPGVVSIYSTKTVRIGPRRSPFGNDPLLDFFFDFPRQFPRELEQRGLGSGFIIDDAGHVLTNHHVVEGADEIKVKLADDRELDAKLVGEDPSTDLALLEIEAEGLLAVPLGDSDVVEVGDWVLAIGDPFGLPQTVSAGIVSAKGRADVGLVEYEDFIQTDAAVNPGNSGGPLVDLEGRVVGVNTAIASRSGGNDGIAFAIPVNMAKAVVQQLLEGGKVVRGQLGIMISDLSDEMARSFGFEGDHGILVQDVKDDSAARAAGLREGDIITKLDGRPVTTVTAFRAEIARREPGTSVRVEVWRSGAKVELSATLGEAAHAATPTQSSTLPPELGLELEDVTPQWRKRLGLEQASGVIVTSVQPGSPAAHADLLPGDVLERVGSEAVKNAAHALSLLAAADLSAGVRLRVRRGGVGRFVLIKTK